MTVETYTQFQKIIQIISTQRLRKNGASFNLIQDGIFGVAH